MSSVEKFWLRVDRRGADECWPWTGAYHGKRAYGSFYFGRRERVAAHRFAFQLANGPIPDGMCVCHRCDVRGCVNPAHLFLGTDADNKRDMFEKGRVPSGERHWRSRLTTSAVEEIRSSSEPNHVLAIRFGVCRSTVSMARRGKRWQGISVPTQPPSRSWTRTVAQ